MPTRIVALPMLPELGYLNPEERWVYVSGVLVVAERSPRPPLLLAHDGHPASHRDVAHAAGVSERLARQSMLMFREHRLLEHDGARPSLWRVPAGIWERLNPAQPRNGRPPSAGREATRERKRAERLRARQGRIA